MNAISRQKWHLVILLVLVLSLVFYWWPRTIDRTYVGYVTSYDGEVDEAVELRMLGQLHRRLLTRYRFAGELIINGVSMPARFGVPGNLRMMVLEFRDRWTGNILSANILTVDEEQFLRIQGRLMLAPDLGRVGGFVKGFDELYAGKNVNFAALATSMSDVSRVIWELSQGTPFPGD